MGRSQPRRRPAVGAVTVPKSLAASLSAALQIPRSLSAGLSAQIDVQGGGNPDANFRYVGVTATGNGSGSDWNNVSAYSTTTFTRGLTYYLRGGNYTSRLLSTANAGTTRITIKRATIADHGTGVGWSDSFASSICAFAGQIEFGSGYWTFDGVTGGGPGQWTSGHGFQVTETSKSAAVFFIGNSNAHGIEIKHTKLVGMNSAGTDGGGWGNDGIALKELTTFNAGSFTASYCWFFGIGRCPVWSPSLGPVGYTVEYSYVDQFNFGSTVHAEIASTGGVTSAACRVIWRYNVLTDIESTGGLMWDCQGNTSAQMHVYGNVFYRPAGRTWQTAGNGCIGGWSGSNQEQTHNVLVYNNTFYNCTGSYVFPVVGFNVTPRNFVAFNNLFYNCGSFVDYSNLTSHDYSHYINSGGTHGESNSTSAASGDPCVNATGLVFDPVSAMTPGTALAAPFNVDMYGVTRDPANWTRGAVQKV
jgi:hypothetical protein